MPLNDINQQMFKQILPIMQTMFHKVNGMSQSQSIDRQTKLISCVNCFFFQSISNDELPQKTSIEHLSTCIQLISTLLTNVTAVIEREMDSVQFTCLGDLPMFCVQFLSKIFNMICSSNDIQLQTLSKCARNAQNLLLLLLTSGKLTIDRSEEHLAYMEQSMFVRRSQFAQHIISYIALVCSFAECSVAGQNAIRCR